MAQHNNKRFEGTLNIDGSASRRKEVVATIVGPGGSNIRRVTQQVRAGTFIRVYDSRQGRNTRARAEDCDTIYISSYKKEAVQKAAQMLRQDIKSVLEGTAPSKPRAIVPCPKEARGTVIGQRATGLKRIQKMCGDGTYIVFKEQFDGFEVTSNSKVSLMRAVAKIGESIHKYYSEQKAWANRKRSTNDNTKVDTTSNGSRFDALVSSSDDDSSDEDEPTQNVEAPKVRRNVTLSIQPRKDYMTEQRNERRLIHQIREELAKRTDPNTGEPLYPAYTIRDKKTRQVIHLEGARAVPLEVAKDELRRRRHEEEIQLEQARGMAQRRREQQEFDKVSNDAKSWPSVSDQHVATKTRITAWSKGVSDTVRDSNFTQKKSASIRRSAPIHRSHKQEPEPTMMDLGTVHLSRREKVAQAGSRSRLISNNTSLQNALGDLASEQSRVEKLTIQTTPKREPVERINSPPPAPEKVSKITDAWGSDDEAPRTKKTQKWFSWADEADTSSDEEGW